MGRCQWVEAWIGQCKNETNNKMCEKHVETCVSCGSEATHSCHETGQFVCGAPLCDDCEHAIFKDGTNGGIGFNAASFSDGVEKRHCKKTEQKHMSWYEK